MAQIITLQKSAELETRSCATCQMVMRLVGIEPHHLTNNEEIYTFECVGCGATTAATVAKVSARHAEA
jgi:hypothetical protein